MRRRRFLSGSLVLAALLLSGCGISMPSDPHGTLERAENGVLRVGVTENPPWVELGDHSPEGTEPALITEFAAHLNARLEWTTGSEAVLVSALERGELDLIAGGFLDDTPWIDRAAATQPYAESMGPLGPEKHVMVVRMGENALLVALERFLYEEGKS